MIIAMCAIVILSTPIHDDSYILNRVEIHARFNSSNEYLEEAIETIYINSSTTEIFDFNIDISDEKIDSGIIKNIKINYKQKLDIPLIWKHKFYIITITIDESNKDHIRVSI